MKLVCISTFDFEPHSVASTTQSTSLKPSIRHMSCVVWGVVDFKNKERKMFLRIRSVMTRHTKRLYGFWSLSIFAFLSITSDIDK